MNIENFEELFGNTPFKNIEKIQEYIDINFIPIQKIKEKIEEYQKMLLSCNRFSDIDRIKAINERILELQELLESEEK